MSRVSFEQATPTNIPHNRLNPAAFKRGVGEYLSSLPVDPDARSNAIFDLLNRGDAAMVKSLFGLEPIDEADIDRYSFHEGDLVIASMARRLLAQAVVDAKGMDFVVDCTAFRDAIDSAGLAARVANFGHYMRETWALKGDEVDGVVRDRLDAARIRRVVLPGAMGGSAIGVGVVKMLLANLGYEAEIELWPIYPDSSHRLRPDDLALIYAYSGNNEEQMVWMAPALEAGAQVVGFAVGGRLEEMCAEANAPFIRIPGETFGLAQPREHMPVAIVLLLEFLGRLGLARHVDSGEPFDLDQWRPRIIASTERLSEMAASTYNADLPLASSPAKQAALFLNWAVTDPARVSSVLESRDPVIWISHLYEPIARRLENQFGECVEHPASAKLMPEDMHNEQEAYVQQWQEHVWGLVDETPASTHLRFVTPRRPLDEIDGAVEGTDRLEARADKLFADLLPGAPKMTFEIRDYGADWPMLGELEALLFCDLTRAFASIYRGVTPHYVHSMNFNKHYMATVPGTPGSTGTY